MVDKKKKILVIEDEDIVREVIVNKLKFEGYEVTAVKNGEDGLTSLEKNPDLIWLDLMLPRMDGFEFLQRMREDPQYRNTPVMVVTNVDNQEKMQKAFGLNVSGYMVKNEHSIGSIVKKISDVFSK